MITIIKPGVLSILRLFYEDKAAKLHLREIARRTKLYGPSVTKFLGVLEKGKILKSEKDGNLKKYSLQKNKFAYLMLEMFDIERFEKLPSIRRNAARYYLGALAEKPVFAVLFGSTAKGNFKEGSDIDILLVVNKNINAQSGEKEAEALAGIKVSTFQIKHDEFIDELKLKEDKVVGSAINSGYPLINHISYYEAIYDERI